MNLLYTQEEIHRIEVYSEYLKKIPDLLKQLETVEKMYQKAILEEKMLLENEDIKNNDNVSKELYCERLASIKKQCEERAREPNIQATASDCPLRRAGHRRCLPAYRFL